MREIGIMTRRIIKLYLRNPLSILFSFVYMLMFLVLIHLFLGDYLAQGMAEVYAEVAGMNFSSMRWLVDWGCRLIPIFSPDNKRMRQSAELLAFSGLWFSAGLSHSLFVSNFRT